MVGEFVKHRLGQEIDGEHYGEVDRSLFIDIVRGTSTRQAELDGMISSALSEDWPIHRLETILRAILRAGAYELLARTDIPPRVVISEYLDVAHAFFAGKEPAMVNGVLDRLARVVRVDRARVGAWWQRHISVNLRASRAIFAPLAGPGALGLLDDAALIDPPPGRQLVLTTDAMVAGVHFLPEDSAELVARKLLRVNLSDLAAMGAAPVGYLMTTALTPECDETWLEGFAAGLAADQKEFSIALLGGDSVATPGPVTLSLTAIGSVATGRAIRRGGARPGDGIYVSGTIGDAALGLRVLRGDLAGLDAGGAPVPRRPLSSAAAASRTRHPSRRHCPCHARRLRRSRRRCRSYLRGVRARGGDRSRPRAAFGRGPTGAARRPELAGSCPCRWRRL